MAEDPKPHPKPVDAAQVVVDPLAPVPHVPGKSDVLVVVPKPIGGQYGLIEAEGKQVIHDVVSHPDLDAEGVIAIHPDFVAKFMGAVEGSRLLKRELSPADEVLEAQRPKGRGELPPMTDAERADAISAQARADAAVAMAQAPQAKAPVASAPKAEAPKAKAPAKK